MWAQKHKYYIKNITGAPPMPKIPVKAYSLKDLLSTQDFVPQSAIDAGADPTPGRPGRWIKHAVMEDAHDHPGVFQMIMSQRFYDEVPARIDYMVSLILNPATGYTPAVIRNPAITRNHRAVEWKPCSTVPRLMEADKEVPEEIGKIIDGWKREADDYYYTRSLVPPIAAEVPTEVKRIIVSYLWTYLIHSRVVRIRLTPWDTRQPYIVAYATYDEWSSSEEYREEQEAEAQKQYEKEQQQQWEEQQALEDRTPEGSEHSYGSWNSEEEREEEEMRLLELEQQQRQMDVDD